MVSPGGSSARSAHAGAAVVGERVADRPRGPQNCCAEGGPSPTDLPTLCRVVRNPEGKASAEPRWSRVQAASLGTEVSPDVGSRGLRTDAATFLSPRHPLQNLRSRMSPSSDVGGSGVAFLADRGTEFLGNGLRRGYFHNSHPQGLGGGGEGKMCVARYCKKQNKPPQTAVFPDAACSSSESAGS